MQLRQDAFFLKLPRNGYSGHSEDASSHPIHIHRAALSLESSANHRVPHSL